MTTLTHYATCTVWSSGNWNECNCKNMPAWRIRKEPEERFPWRIWRRTDDEIYEPLLRASSWFGAMQFVRELVKLRNNTLPVEEPRA